MSNTTALQLLPLIQPSQAQKHVTHNAALAVLDVLVQTSALSRTLTAPPGGVLAGACYIVANGATGVWLAQDRNVAVYSGSYWDFYLPKTGWRVWLEAETTEAVFDGAVWTTSANRTERVAGLGISATADDTNRLTVSADATLLTNAGAGHQLKINKATAANTASLLFQTGFSGRAEMGNVGSNDFVLKVSANGTTFLTGLTIEAATGRVLASNGINLVSGSGDPASPQNGDVWYNSTANRLRARQGGRTVDLFNPLFSDAEFRLQDDGDPTRQAVFQLSGIATATTRTLIVPNASGTVALTGDPILATQISNSTAAGRTVLTATDAAAQRTVMAAEGTANKGVVNGYAGLDSAGKVPAAQLPSYVDDVLEFANLAALPGTGETGKIYVTLDTNKTYRWSGSVYVEISASPGSTDVVTEGAGNLYFTNARAIAAPLTGFAAAGARTAMIPADSVLVALQKTQKYHTDLSALAFSAAFSDLTAVPTTLAGHFITNGVDLTSTQTISGNKTFTGAIAFTGTTITADSNFTLQDDLDSTKKAQFQLSSITTGTTLTYTLPNGSGTLATLNAAQTFAGVQIFSNPGNSFGTSTAAGTTALASGATTAGSTKTVSIGTGGAAGSTTSILVGPTAGAGTLAFGSGLTAITFPDSAFTLQDNVDATKQAKFEVSGMTTGTTRILTLPDANGTLALNTVVSTMANGLAPASGGGTMNFLRADGIWSAPASSSAYASLTGLPAAVDAIDGLTPSADTLAYYTGAITGALATLTPFGRSLIDDADSNTARATLGLGTMATQATNAVAVTGGTITGTGFKVPPIPGVPATSDFYRVSDTICYRDTANVERLLLNSTDNLANLSSIATARINLERQDYSTRAAFVTWATGRIPSTGLIMRAAGYAYSYIGTGTAISDLPGWVPFGTATALHWNADNTGATSAVAGVSSLIDYVNSIGGGIAFLPKGTYLWPTALTKQALNGVILEGEGNGTKIVRNTNLTSWAIRFWGGANNRIRRILIDSAGYSGRGILLQDRFSGIEDCECNNCPDRPFGMNGGGNTVYGLDSLGRNSDDGTFTTATFFPVACYLENCRVSRAGSTAFSQKQMHYSRIQRCYAKTVYSEGLTIDRTDYSICSNNTLLDCALTLGNQWPDLVAGSGFLAVGGGGVGAVGIDNSNGSRFVKNTIIGVNNDTVTRNNRNRAAICFINNLGAANGCEVEGNYISDAKSGVWLVGTVSGAAGNNFSHIITANVFDSIGTAAGTGTAQFGAVWIDAGCTGNVITNNSQVGGTPLITGASGLNVTDRIILGTLASDPSGPANGTIWYNATTNQLKAQSGGVSAIIDSQQSVGWLTPVSGDHMMTTMGAGSSTGALGGAADRIDIFPFTARADNPITGLSVNVTIAVAAALGKIVMYDSDANGRPNTLILETSNLDFSTAGVKSATVSTTLRQGKTYWFGIRHNSTATLSSWLATATPDINGGAPTSNARKVVRRNLTYATAAPSTWGWVSSDLNTSANTATAIWLRV